MGIGTSATPANVAAKLLLSIGFDLLAARESTFPLLVLLLLLPATLAVEDKGKRHDPVFPPAEAPPLFVAGTQAREAEDGTDDGASLPAIGAVWIFCKSASLAVAGGAQLPGPDVVPVHHV